MTTLVFVLVLGLVLGWVWFTRTASTPKEPYTSPRDIQKLLDRASYWALSAERNPNAREALQQASYAMGYLYALQDLVPVEELDRHIDFPDFRKRVTDIHAKLKTQNP
jgi:hypothetical protein